MNIKKSGRDRTLATRVRENPTTGKRRRGHQSPCDPYGLGPPNPTKNLAQCVGPTAISK